MRLLLFLLTAIAVVAAAATRVADTINDGTGHPLNGTCVISWAGFTTAAGRPVAGGSRTVTVRNGVFDITLDPTAGSAPNNSLYRVQCAASGLGASPTEWWNVQDSGVKLRISDVRVSTGGAPPDTGITLYTPDRALKSDSAGRVAAVSGNAADCVKADGSSGACGGGGSGTVSGQVQDKLTVGGASATSVTTSGCAVSGASKDHLACDKSVAAADTANSGALDLRAKTSLKYYTIDAPDSGAAQVHRLPAAVPATTKYAMRVASSTSTPITYPDGSSDTVPVLQYEWFNPAEYTLYFYTVNGKDSPYLGDSAFCSLNLTAAAGNSVLLYDCSGGSATSEFRLKDFLGNLLRLSSAGFGWSLTGLSADFFAGVPVKTAQKNSPPATASIGTTTLGSISVTGFGNVCYSVDVRNGGTGTVALTLNWNNPASQARTFTTSTATGGQYLSACMPLRGTGNVTYSTIVTGTVSYDYALTLTQ